MSCRVITTPQANRQFEKLDRQFQDRVRRAIEALADNPRPMGCVKLSGPEGWYRIRVGDYRIIYDIQDRQLVVIVIRIGHRREVYR
jgi:mRNA interferase RelE/StbE